MGFRGSRSGRSLSLGVAKPHSTGITKRSVVRCEPSRDNANVDSLAKLPLTLQVRQILMEGCWPPQSPRQSQDILEIFAALHTFGALPGVMR